MRKGFSPLGSSSSVLGLSSSVLDSILDWAALTTPGLDSSCSVLALTTLTLQYSSWIADAVLVNFGSLEELARLGLDSSDALRFLRLETDGVTDEGTLSGVDEPHCVPTGESLEVSCGWRRRVATHTTELDESFRQYLSIQTSKECM